MILVTGASGFVGLNLVEAILTRGEDVLAFGLAPFPEVAAREFSALPGRLVCRQGDIRDGARLKMLFRDYPILAVIHAAAITPGRDQEAAQIDDVIDVNLKGTVTTLRAAVRRGVRRFLYVSSGAVYGDGGFTGSQLVEDATPALPTSLYGISKYAAERTCLNYRARGEIDAIVARVSSAFGRWEYRSGARDTLSPHLLVHRLARQGKPAVLSRPGVRDWIYGPDVAQALLALLDLETSRHAVYNVGTGAPWSMAAWCERLAAAVPGFAWRLATDPREANVDLQGERDRAPLSITRLVEDTDFRCRYGLDAALDDFIRWSRTHGLWAS